MELIFQRMGNRWNVVMEDGRATAKGDMGMQKCLSMNIYWLSVAPVTTF